MNGSSLLCTAAEEQEGPIFPPLEGEGMPRGSPGAHHPALHHREFVPQTLERSAILDPNKTPAPRRPSSSEKKKASLAPYVSPPHAG